MTVQHSTARQASQSSTLAPHGAPRAWLPRFLRLDLGRPSRQHWLGYILLAPAVIMIAGIIVYPLVLSLDLSFQDVKIPRLDRPRQPFTLDNYARLFTSSDFWFALFVTLRLIAIVTVGVFVVGIATALLVNNRFRGRALVRLAVALPWAIPEVIAAVIFTWIFHATFGVASWMLFRLNLVDHMVGWFSDPALALSVICTTMIWKGYPFVTIMVLAGLQSIPEDFYQAAKVDGANAWQRFANITIPCLMPILGVTAVLVVLWIFRDFSTIYVLTGGGPLRSTQTLSIMTYEESFGFFRMGYASALGIVTFVLCALAAVSLVGRRADSIY
jgi:multiple sugar transport system permease protein